MDFSVSKLCQDSHECARDKGWLETPRSSSDIMNLFVSEISEALEDYRANRGIKEIFYEVKFKEEDGKIVKEIVSRDNIDAARAVEGKYGRGRSFLEAKPCGIPIEIADFVIRLGEYCGTNKLNLEFWFLESAKFLMRLERDGGFPKGMDEFLGGLTVLTAKSMQHPEKVLDVEYLGQALGLAFMYCTRADIPLKAAIEEKHAFNLTRSHRHGGKKI